MVKAQAGKSVEILMYEQIGKDFWSDEGIGAKDFAEELKALGDISDIVLRINSPGGSVFEGLAIYNQLKSHKARKTVHIDGLCASIASVIAMAGDNIVMPENALMMIHDPHALAMGTSIDMRKMADMLDKTAESMLSIYMTKYNKTEADMRKVMTDETWLSAKDCQEAGFCDTIAEPVKMAAHFDLSKFKNAPEALKAQMSNAAQAQAAGAVTPAAQTVVTPQATATQTATAAVSAQIQNSKGKITMNKCKHCGAELAAGASCSCHNAVDAKMSDINDILAMAEKHNQLPLAQKMIKEGKSKEEFVCAVLEAKGARPVQVDANIGMEQKEVKRFSMLKAINAMANPQDKRARDAAGLEFEASQAVSDRLKKSPQGFFLPMDVMGAKQDYSTVRADLLKGTGSAGGYTVQTDLLSASFIEMLVNAMQVKNMGARILDGLVGDVAIPSQTGGATSYWVAENAAPTESQQTFGQVAMTPKSVGAFTDLSRKLIIQSSIGVENLVRMDLALAIALAIDSAALHGPGTGNAPTGIAATAGIGSVAGGTNGLAPTWGNAISLWAAVANANAAFGSTGFLTNTKVIGKLMQTQKASGTDSTMVINQFPDQSGFTNLAGARCGVSNQVSSALTKGTSNGVCSAIFYGNWADLIIGQWGAIDVLIDPYTGGAAGTVRVRVLQDVDIAVRHAASFSAMLDALTT